MRVELKRRFLLWLELIYKDTKRAMIRDARFAKNSYRIRKGPHTFIINKKKFQLLRDGIIRPNKVVTTKV